MLWSFDGEQSKHVCKHQNKQNKKKERNVVLGFLFLILPPTCFLKSFHSRFWCWPTVKESDEAASRCWLGRGATLGSVDCGMRTTRRIRTGGEGCCCLATDHRWSYTPGLAHPLLILRTHRQHLNNTRPSALSISSNQVRFVPFIYLKPWKWRIKKM